MFWPISFVVKWAINLHVWWLNFLHQVVLLASVTEIIENDATANRSSELVNNRQIWSSQLWKRVLLDAGDLKVPKILLSHLFMLYLLQTVLSVHVNLNLHKGVIFFCVAGNCAANRKSFAKILHSFRQEFKKDSLEFNFVQPQTAFACRSQVHLECYIDALTL